MIAQPPESVAALQESHPIVAAQFWQTKVMTERGQDAAMQELAPIVAVTY